MINLFCFGPSLKPIFATDSVGWRILGTTESELTTELELKSKETENEISISICIQNASVAGPGGS